MAPQSALVGKTLAGSAIREQFHCMVVGFEHDDTDTIDTATAGRIFRSGDTVWLVGTDQGLTALRRALRERNIPTFPVCDRAVAALSLYMDGRLAAGAVVLDGVVAQVVHHLLHHRGQALDSGMISGKSTETSAGACIIAPSGFK